MKAVVCNSFFDFMIGTKYTQFYKFKDNQVLVGIDYYIKGRYFIIVVGPTTAIYKMTLDGMYLF